MIKSTEVRLGNWINYQSETEPKQQVQVNISDLILIDKSERAVEYTPIPLDPEVLGACGFDGLRRLYLPDCKKQCYPDENRPKICAIENDFFELSRSGLASYHFCINYLHQLQNLFFTLTGEEISYQPKTIKP